MTRPSPRRDLPPDWTCPNQADLLDLICAGDIAPEPDKENPDDRFTHDADAH